MVAIGPPVDKIGMVDQTLLKNSLYCIPFLSGGRRQKANLHHAMKNSRRRLRGARRCLVYLVHLHRRQKTHHIERVFRRSKRQKWNWGECMAILSFVFGWRTFSHYSIDHVINWYRYGFREGLPCGEAGKGRSAIKQERNHLQTNKNGPRFS